MSPLRPTTHSVPPNPSGILDYDGKDEKSFSNSTIDDYDFYYSDSDYGKYALDDLSFVAGDNLTLPSRCTYRLLFRQPLRGGQAGHQPADSASGSSQGDIRYYATYNTNVQINANDIARLFRKKNPSSHAAVCDTQGCAHRTSITTTTRQQVWCLQAEADQLQL